MALLSGPYLFAISWLDAACFFELGTPLRWFVAAGFPGLALLGSPHGRMLAGVGIVWMLLILPEVRWNHAKSFYVDARRLAVGMEAAEVRAIMEPHIEVGVDYQPTADERESFAARGPNDGMLFIHCPLGWTDHCTVELDGQGRARAIDIEKD